MMKRNDLPDSKEWEKIVEEAFASDEVHIFSERYNLKKNQMKGNVVMKKKINIIAAFAAAAAVCCGVCAFIPNNNTAEIPDTVSVAETQNVQKNSFFISASAAEIEPEGDFSLDMQNAGVGEFPYSGTGFFVHGNNIGNVTLSIDKGALYKSDYKMPAIDEKPETGYAESCEYIGNSYTGVFDEKIVYGFYLSDDIFNEYESQGKNAWHKCYDEFDGATLEISVEYNDGETDSASYTLKSGKLELDKATMKLNGKFSDGSTPYIYGVQICKNE